MRAPGLTSRLKGIRRFLFMAPTFGMLLLTPGVVQATHSASEPSDGTVRSFIAVDPPRKVSPFQFYDGNGRPITLAAFRGKVILLNLWATWCPPCIREMPALDRLQSKFKKSEFVVIALSLDRGGGPVVRTFYQKYGLRHLGMFLDPDKSAGAAFPVDVLPASFILGRDGRLKAFLRSFADWDAPEAEAMIRHLILAPQNGN